MKFRGKVVSPMYEHNDKKYMRLRVPPEMARVVLNIEAKNNYKLNPEKYIQKDFFDNTLTLKIPFRYRRVMCPMSGRKPIQEVVTGDEVDVEVEYTGVWHAGDYGGHSWKIKNIHIY